MATIKTANIEYILEKKYIKALRKIFQYDELFPYNEEIEKSKVIITSTFPEKKEEFRIPQIVTTGINYAFSHTSLFNNYYDDIIENEIVVGHRYLTQVPYSLSLLCLASNDGTAKDLANITMDYVWFTANELFNDVLGLNLTSATKSPGGLQRNMPDKAFAHSVNLSGTLSWMGEKVMDKQLLQKIRIEIEKE